MLIITRNTDEGIDIFVGDIKIVVTAKGSSGRRQKIGIEAPRELVRIQRHRKNPSGIAPFRHHPKAAS